MTNASDIITYIGIPLAVLGVLPILYTAINSLITIRKIKQSLRHNGLFEATTRSSLMSGVVEVTLPRFSITPLDREEDTEYWKLNRRPSTLKGGTWTILNWNLLITGSRLYRLQYSDDLQIPQAEIDFGELMAFLLDRGAVPDIKGLHMLRVSGLWTPTGTSLLLSPDTLDKVLKVSVPNDSDGVLSLTLHWSSAWDQRDPKHLSPGWMRLSLPVDPKQTSDDALEKQPAHPRPTSIRFRLDHVGSSVSITHAVWEHENEPLVSSPSLDHLWYVHFGVALSCSVANSGHIAPFRTHFRVSPPCSVPNLGPQVKALKQTPTPAPEPVSPIHVSAFDQEMLTQKYTQLRSGFGLGPVYSSCAWALPVTPTVSSSSRPSPHQPGHPRHCSLRRTCYPWTSG